MTIISTNRIQPKPPKDYGSSKGLFSTDRIKPKTPTQGEGPFANPVTMSDLRRLKAEKAASYQSKSPNVVVKTRKKRGRKKKEA